MKTKLLTICSVLFIQALAFAQPATNVSTLPYYDGFAYTLGGALIGQGNWTNATTSTVDDIIVTGLTSPSGLQAATGNAVNIVGGNSDPIKYFTDQTSGTVYYSFLVRINAGSGTGNFYDTFPTATPGQFISLGQQSSTTPANTNYGACVFSRMNANATINFGLVLDSTVGNVVWDTTTIVVGTTYMVVVSNTFDSTTPTAKLWINPVINGTEPVSTLTTTTGTNRTNLDRVYIRQDSNAKTPNMDLDELRIGNTWNSVAPVATAGVASNELNKISLYPNPTKNTLNIDSKDLTIDAVSIYSIDGKVILNQNSINNNTIDVSNLSSGMYVVKMSSNENVLTRKIIIE